MSVRVMTEVWAATIAPGDKLVLLAIADCANDEGVAWPSIKTLCKKSGKSERAAQGSIKVLVEAGHLTRVEKPGKGCLYTVHPRIGCAPAETAPPQKSSQTPAETADKPSGTTTRSEAKASSRRKPEVPIPDGFPDADAVAWGKAESAASNALVDSEMQAKRFRAHAEQVDRRARDWSAAWRNWILKSIAEAPRAAPVRPAIVRPAPFPDPALRARVVAEEDDAFAMNYLDPAEWTPDGIRPANGYAFDKLRHLRSLKDVKLLQPQERAA